jgi:hypothetical protein
MPKKKKGSEWYEGGVYGRGERERERGGRDKIRKEEGRQARNNNWMGKFNEIGRLDRRGTIDLEIRQI